MDFFDLTGWAFGVFGTVVAVYAYLRTRNVVRLSARAMVRSGLRTLTRFPNTPPVTINDKVINHNIDQLICLIKNSGNSTIKQRDVVEPLLIRPSLKDGASLVYVGIQSLARKENKSLRVTQKGAEIVVEWAYLDPGEKLKVLALIDGGVDGANYEGHFLGGGKIVKGLVQDKADLFASVFASVMVGIIFFGGAIMGVLWTFFKWDAFFWGALDFEPTVWGGMLALMIGASLSNFLVVGFLTAALMGFASVRRSMRELSAERTKAST